MANIKSLIDVSAASTLHAVPDLAGARYDFDSGTFRTAEGAPLSDETLERWGTAARRSGAASLGRRTLKRGIFLRSLSSAPRGSRPGLLERILRLGSELLSPDTKGIFYAKGGLSDRGTMGELLIGRSAALPASLSRTEKNKEVAVPDPLLQETVQTTGSTASLTLKLHS